MCLEKRPVERDVGSFIVAGYTWFIKDSVIGCHRLVSPSRKGVVGRNLSTFNKYNSNLMVGQACVSC